MGRSRYRVVEDKKTYFLTSSVVHWLPLFAVPPLAEIVIESLNFLCSKDRMKIHAWVLMETHLHLIATCNDTSGEMRKFKSFTARRIVDALGTGGPVFLLNQLRFYKKRHKEGQTFQVWQEGLHPKVIPNEGMLKSTVDYIHYNPVKRGYVDDPVHWRYSSARDYGGEKGLVEIEKLV